MSPEGSVVDVDSLVVVFCRFHFLKFTQEVKSNHSSLSSHVYPGWMVT